MAEELSVTEEELELFLAYAKLEDLEETEKRIAKTCFLGAKNYLANTGVVKPEADTELYDLASWSLGLHYYDHRDAVGNEAAIPTGLRPILNQLKQLGEAVAGATI